MIKYICDICQREVNTPNDLQRLYYGMRAYEFEVCEDCAKKFNEFKERVLEKYDKMHDELDKKEREELNEFIDSIQESIDENK